MQYIERGTAKTKKLLLFVLVLVVLSFPIGIAIAEEEAAFTFGPEYTEPDETRSNGPEWTCNNIFNETNGQLIGKGCWRNYQNKMQGKYIAFAYSGIIFVHGGSGNFVGSECATPGNPQKVEVNRDGPKPDSYALPYFNSYCQ